MDSQTTKARIRGFVRDRWQSRPLAGATWAAEKYLSIYRNNEHDLLINGESEVIRRHPADSLKTVLDVGMWHGTWTDVVREHHPHALVHGFEASPATAEDLVQRYAGVPEVTIATMALGSEPGTAMLHVDNVDTSITSLLPSPGSTTTPVQVAVQRGDQYLHDTGIQHVDYLKIDVEGFDFKVLQGFSEALGGGAVTSLQFEYNDWNIIARHLLADFYDLLDPLGFAIGKVHPDGVNFRSYEPRQEDWVGPSCVAVRRDRPELIRALRL